VAAGSPASTTELEQFIRSSGTRSRQFQNGATPLSNLGEIVVRDELGRGGKRAGWVGRFCGIARLAGCPRAFCCWGFFVGGGRRDGPPGSWSEGPSFAKRLDWIRRRDAGKECLTGAWGMNAGLTEARAENHAGPRWLRPWSGRKRIEDEAVARNSGRFGRALKARFSRDDAGRVSGTGLPHVVRVRSVFGRRAFTSAQGFCPVDCSECLRREHPESASSARAGPCSRYRAPLDCRGGGGGSARSSSGVRARRFTGAGTRPRDSFARC